MFNMRIVQDFFYFLLINKCCHSSKANVLVIEKDDMERQLWSEFRGKGNSLFDKVEEKADK